MDEAIINHIKRDYKLLIGQQTAEEIKLEIGSAWDLREELQAEVRGRDMLTGLPKTVILTSEEVRRALDEPVTQIIEAIKSTLDKTPPELVADIMERGIVLAGGGSLLTGLDERLRHETQMPVHLAESPLTCVAVGSGRSLEGFEAIHRATRPVRVTASTTLAGHHQPALNIKEIDTAPRRTTCSRASTRSSCACHEALHRESHGATRTAILLPHRRRRSPRDRACRWLADGGRRGAVCASSNHHLRFRAAHRPEAPPARDREGGARERRVARYRRAGIGALRRERL